MANTLTKADIVEKIYQYSKKNRTELKEILEHLLFLIKKGLKEEGSVLVSGFGKFEAYQKNPRKGRNPQTNETIILPGRKVVVFRISKKFRSELNS
ncbi:MAG: integration host factor subunit alpha [Desulfonauticus sp.]|jgi:integration host factor subunit alpha|nr:integration host factor subunit alpha [Desulfonauticus sp.]